MHIHCAYALVSRWVAVGCDGRSPRSCVYCVRARSASQKYGNTHTRSVITCAGVVLAAPYSKNICACALVLFTPPCVCVCVCKQSHMCTRDDRVHGYYIYNTHARARTGTHRTTADRTTLRREIQREHDHPDAGSIRTGRAACSDVFQYNVRRRDAYFTQKTASHRQPSCRETDAVMRRDRVRVTAAAVDVVVAVVVVVVALVIASSSQCGPRSLMLSVSSTTSTTGRRSVMQ